MKDKVESEVHSPARVQRSLTKQIKKLEAQLGEQLRYLRGNRSSSDEGSCRQAPACGRLGMGVRDVRNACGSEAVAQLQQRPPDHDQAAAPAQP